MKRTRRVKDLSAEELRRLLVEKRRADRQARLAYFRKTGRVVELVSDLDSPLLDLSQGTVLDNVEDNRERRSTWSGLKRIFDGLLLLVEIGAVIGLVVILLNGLDILDRLNQEAIIALEQPTLTPTPLIMAIVLPSGHTSPDTPGGARPNEAEIPQHLQPLVQSLANIPIPTPGPEQAVRIQIPAIHVDAPVVQGDGWEQLKKGVGQHIGTFNPGEEGNIVLSAHNDIFGEIFRDLDKLQPGDIITLFTSQRTYTYVITSSKIVEPTQVEVMAQTTTATLTLVSCYPYRVDDMRIAIIARLYSGN
ncbi:MAG: sortase [Anaerolineales bacterium]|nr:sortase [Anaerolineales bacterium]